MNNKGQTFIDVAVVVIVLFIAGVAFVLVNGVQDEIHDQMISDGDLNAEAVVSLNQFNADFATTFDNIFLLVFILLWIFIIVSSIFVDANPIFIIIGVVLLIFVLIFTAVMSNTYQEFASDDDIYLFSSEFPKMNYILEHLVMFIVFIAVSSLVAIYGKNNFFGGQAV